MGPSMTSASSRIGRIRTRGLARPNTAAEGPVPASGSFYVPINTYVVYERPKNVWATFSCSSPTAVAGSGSGSCPSGAHAATVSYGSSAYPTSLQWNVAPPGTPTSFSVGGGAGASATLQWTAPATATGAPVNFYRIYRDGQLYTNRYDTVDAPPTPYDSTTGDGCNGTTCYYTDPASARGGSTHQYSVTAVGGNTPGWSLAESTITGSAAG